MGRRAINRKFRICQRWVRNSRSVKASDPLSKPAGSPYRGVGRTGPLSKLEPPLSRRNPRQFLGGDRRADTRV